MSCPCRPVRILWSAFLVGAALGLLPPSTLEAATVEELVAQVEQLTAELLTQAQAAAEGQAAVSSERTLLDIATERHDAMVTLQQQAPGEFFRLAMDPEVRQTLSAEIQAQTESSTTKQGVLEITHEDDFPSGQGTTSYTLKEASATYQLQFVKEPPSAPLGTTVEGVGVLLDQTITLYAAQLGAGFRVITAAVPPSLGERKTLALLVNFQADPQTGGITPASAFRHMFAASVSVNMFFQEASYGKTSVTGTVSGWHTLPNAPSCDLTGSGGIAEGAIAAADAAIDFSQYDHLVFMVNPGFYCRAHDGGVRTYSTAEGQRSFRQSNLYGGFSVASHELGHSFGASHGNGWDCPLTLLLNLDENQDCSIGYFDPFDVMGLGAAGHPNVSHKEKLAWFDPGHILDVDVSSQSGLFTIKPLEVNSPDPKMIRIHRGNFQPVYYVEHRWPIGFDASLPNISYAQFGALLHWTHAERPIIRGGDTQLVDMTPNSQPGSADFDDAALLLNETFTEPL